MWTNWRPGSRGQRGDQPVVARDAVERDVVDVAHEMMRVDVMMLHQSGKRRPEPWKCIFWTRRASIASHAEQPLDIGGHALVDQLEQAGRCRVEAIVEVEDPVADVGEAAGPCRAEP